MAGCRSIASILFRSHSCFIIENSKFGFIKTINSKQCQRQFVTLSPGLNIGTLSTFNYQNNSDTKKIQNIRQFHVSNCLNTPKKKLSERIKATCNQFIENLHQSEAFEMMSEVSKMMVADRIEQKYDDWISKNKNKKTSNKEDTNKKQQTNEETDENSDTKLKKDEKFYHDYIRGLYIYLFISYFIVTIFIMSLIFIIYITGLLYIYKNISDINIMAILKLLSILSR